MAGEFSLTNDPFLTHVPAALGATQGSGTVGAPGSRARIGRHKSLKTPVQLVTETSGVPLAVFVVITASFTFLYHFSPGFCCFMVVLGLAATVFVGTHGHDHLYGRGFYDWTPMAMCLLAVLCSVIVGVYNYSFHMQVYYISSWGPSYTNVLPSEPAAAHGDGGKLVFADSSRVDTTMAVGFMDKQTYCVAPILDGNAIAKVGYWAVGIDCCGARGTFWCDDAADKDARSALVTVPETTRLQDLLFDKARFKGRRAHFMEAVAQAAAVYDIVPEEHPVFVRWVKLPSFAEAAAYWKGMGVFLLSSGIFLLLALVAGSLVTTMHARASSP